MFCNNCGKEYPADSKFCTLCGATLVVDARLPSEKTSKKPPSRNGPSKR